MLNLFRRNTPEDEGSKSSHSLWCKVNPTRSYVGVTEVSTEPFPAGFKLIGATPAINESLPILGRALDWSSFNEMERAQIRDGSYSMTLGKFKTLMRK
jgi:hypothetical protein